MTWAIIKLARPAQRARRLLAWSFPAPAEQQIIRFETRVLRVSVLRVLAPVQKQTELVPFNYSRALIGPAAESPVWTCLSLSFMIHRPRQITKLKLVLVVALMVARRVQVLLNRTVRAAIYKAPPLMPHWSRRILRRHRLRRRLILQIRRKRTLPNLTSHHSHRILLNLTSHQSVLRLSHWKNQVIAIAVRKRHG